MAKQVDEFRVTLCFVKNGAAYDPVVESLSGKTSDPAATNKQEKDGGPVASTTLPAYTGTDTLDTFKAACLARVKTDGGVA